MNDLIDELKIKYQYDDKTINALSKVLPAFYLYYGDLFKDIISNAIKDTKIICCNSFETVSKIAKESKLTNCIYNISNNMNEVYDKDGAYLSNINVLYNDMKNIYEINSIDRKIVISHTFNLDSPKGLEVLIFNLCRLIKSYNNEYLLKENTITKREGISNTNIRIVMENNEINLLYENEYAKGINFGLNIYDTEQILGIVLKDKYDSYQYSSVKSMAQILKEYLLLKDEINKSEIYGDSSFFNVYNKNQDLSDDLIRLADECLNLEHEMIVYTYSREEKDDIKEKINDKMCNDVCNNFIEFKRNKKSELIKKS